MASIEKVSENHWFTRKKPKTTKVTFIRILLQIHETSIQKHTTLLFYPKMRRNLVSIIQLTSVYHSEGLIIIPN